MNYIFFDNDSWQSLLPLTFTRPVSEIRVGILTIREKWEKRLNFKISNLTQNYLQEKYVKHIENENILINSSVLPDEKIIQQIQNLKLNQALIYKNNLIACKIIENQVLNFDFNNLNNYKIIEIENCKTIEFPWQIFSENEKEIEMDYKLITYNRKSEIISQTNRCFQTERIFLEKGAKVECAILNPDNGYIYIGEDAEIMEGSIVRGSLAICQHSALKLGTKIYGATTIGPFSKVGGEVNNSVIFGYSNKGHDGFLGNSVLGEWCNLGADTNNSNLKNNYAEVKIWSYKDEKFIKTGLQFCGLIMADHSKCGINTMFNTGTVVGVSCNIFGSGFPRNFIPSFSWGGASGFEDYSLKNACETAKLVMKRRNIDFNDIEKNILTHIFEQTAKYRKI